LGVAMPFISHSNHLYGYISCWYDIVWFAVGEMGERGPRGPRGSLDQGSRGANGSPGRLQVNVNDLLIQ